MPGRIPIADRWWMRNCVKPFSIAAAFVYTTSLYTLGLQAIFPYPFLFLFFIAVMGSAWFGGFIAGSIAVALSTVVIDFFFVPPYFSFAVNKVAVPYFISFVVCAAVVGWVSASRRRAESQIREARDLLEQRVQERTAELEQSNRELQESERSLRELQAQLADVNRVMSMGAVTASIAHEINQPLAAIVANAYACVAWLKSGNVTRAESTAEKIVEDGTRAGSIVARLRALFQKGEEKRACESINAIILETVRILRDETARRQIPLRTHLATNLPPVRVDRVQIQQALFNLAINGMDAMETTPTGTAELLFTSSLDESGNIHVMVADCGAGIPTDLQEQIFDPFFTTKATGLGIGLSISRTIIEAHEGRLWAAARPEGGSVFQFMIPAEP
jgi:C4-dicarboxylate-specific signal transduction histidine kinase